MRVRSAALGLALLAAACSDREPARSPAPAAAAPVAAAPPAPLPVPAAPPPGAESIDLALKAVQDFNTAAAAELTAIGEAEIKYRATSAQALQAGRAGDVPAAARRLAEIEAAHKAAAERLAAFQAASASLAPQLTAATEACAATPQMTSYAACVILPTEQATLTANVEAVTKRFDAAEAVWRQERAKLEEVAATVALGR